MVSTNLSVTEQRVARVRAELELSDTLVEKVLEKGIDYGLHPGTNSFALKDPGANTIINAFNCYPKAEVLFREVAEPRSSYGVDGSLISREDSLVKATGTGAATTMETRYGYRWVSGPESYGFDREGLRKRKDDSREVYRIPNPEWSELENTILKMARKRGEVDAAMALPGVSRFLARLNSRQQPQRKPGPPGEDWTGFWTRTRAMGLDDAQVHQLLGVASMKEWTDQGKTLNDAIRVLSEELAKLKRREGE